MGSSEERLIIPLLRVGGNIIFQFGRYIGLGRLGFGLRKLSDYYVKFGVFGRVGL